MGTLKHKNNVKLNNGEIITNEDKLECVTCKTSLGQYSVDKHFKTRTHLDNVEGITKDKITKETSGYCDICNTRYNNKEKHNESDEHKESDKQRKLSDGNWRDKN